LLAGAAPLIAAPALSKFALAGEASAAEHDHSEHVGHAAMVGEGAPAVGGPRDLDALLYPPPLRAARPGRVAEYELVAHDREV
jgi:hypothetical protein